MRLSPVFFTMVAIAAPLSIPLSAKAQATNNSKQTTEFFTPPTNQENEVVGVFPAASVAKQTPEVIVPTPATPETAQTFEISQQTTTATTPTTNQQQEVVGVFPAANTAKATPQVIVPTSQTSNNSQTTRATGQQTVNQQGNSVVKSGASALKTTPIGTSSVVVSGASALKTTPRGLKRISKGNIAQNLPPTSPPDIPPPGTDTQQTPFQAPTTPPNQQDTTPPGTTPQNQQPPSQQAPATTPNQQDTTPPGTTPQNQQPPSQQAPATTPNQQDITPPGTTPQNQPNQTPEAAEPRVLVSEVFVRSQTGQPLPQQLENEVYRVVRTQPGRTTTRSQLQEDINAVFGTGFFSNVQAVPEDTPLGVRVSFVVQPNPVLKDVNIQANVNTGVPSVIDPKVVDQIFKNQYGQILNLRDLQQGIQQLTKRYQEQGYVLSQVVGAPQVSQDGIVTLQVAEGVVEDIRVNFRGKEGQETDEKGQPIRGRTQPYIVTRELQLQPGQVFNRNTVQRDLQRVFGLGLFEDVNVSLDPGTDPSKVDVIVNVVERNTGSVAAGAGISSASGLFGTISYQEQNLNGRNQKLGAELQVGQRELLFDLRFTDPWIAGDPYRTSYTVNAFRRRSISLIFDGQDEEIETFDPEDPTEEGDRPRVLRLGGGVTFTRPLSRNPYERAEWTATAGLQYQRVSVRDRDGDLREQGTIFQNDTPGELIDLSQSGEGQDDLLLLQLGAIRDKRNNALQPTSGSYFRLGLDQSVPVGLGNIFLTRVRGSYSQYLPVDFTNFTKGPETLAFNVQAGTVLGDLPPYEAFTLGGSNSVRGYEEGALGSGRSFVQASVEYRFPVFSVVSGALFFDVGSDLGSATRPAELLDKNGTGYGYGVGVRVQSPLGPIRIDYGINDDGDSRINFGIGERF